MPRKRLLTRATAEIPTVSIHPCQKTVRYFQKTGHPWLVPARRDQQRRAKRMARIAPEKIRPPHEAGSRGVSFQMRVVQGTWGAYSQGRASSMPFEPNPRSADIRSLLRPRRPRRSQPRTVIRAPRMSSRTEPLSARIRPRSSAENGRIRSRARGVTPQGGGDPSRPSARKIRRKGPSMSAFRERNLALAPPALENSARDPRSSGRALCVQPSLHASLRSPGCTDWIWGSLRHSRLCLPLVGPRHGPGRA